MITWADPQPPDVIATALCMIAAGWSLRAASAGGPHRADKWIWLVSALVTTGIAVNKQSDAHSLLLKASASYLASRGVRAQGSLIPLWVLILAALCAGLLIATLTTLNRRGFAPGHLGLAGLCLMVLHGLGRGAMHLHVLETGTYETLARSALLFALGAGSGLVTLAAIRSTRQHPEGQGIDAKRRPVPYSSGCPQVRAKYSRSQNRK